MVSATLVDKALVVRRWGRASYGYLCALLMSVLIALGFFIPRSDSKWFALLLIFVWAAVLVRKLIWKLRGEHRRASGFEFALLILVGLYAFVQWSGGVLGIFHPIIYVALAAFAAYLKPRAWIACWFAACSLETASYWFAEGQPYVADFLVHLFFLTAFAVLGHVSIKAQVFRAYRRAKIDIETEKKRLINESRLFRLISPASGGAQDEERMYESSVREVHESLYHVLRLLHGTLELHTCALLMLSDDEEQLHITELVTTSRDIAEGPFTVGKGALGAAVRRRMVTKLDSISPDYTGICYYRGPLEVRSLVAVPIVEGNHLRGLLCADRKELRPFSEREEQTLVGAGGHILRALENERVFVQLERSKSEQTILYKASRALGAALNQDAVFRSAMEAVAQFVPYDFAALTEYDVATRRHRVCYASGDDADEFLGLSFKENASLTAMAVKNQHYLPYRGEFDAERQTVFTQRARLEHLQSLLILPLMVRDETMGTLVIGARRPKAFGDSVRASLQVLSNHLAVAWSNTVAVKRLEEMATTDGLTGCLNKRIFLEELDRKIRAARRFNRKLSLIVTDIDHFKSINDTYGHATGDRVLKELGRILQNVKRETDIVARFGGEEFCILCEETGIEGARQFAERVREELGNTNLHCDSGMFQVTASLGVATFPDHASTPEELFETTDRALYVAKKSGRNRVQAA